MHSIVTLTRPAMRDTLSHLPAPRLRQTGRMGEGGGLAPLWVHVHRAVQKGTGDLARQRRTTDSANPRRFGSHTTITRTLAQTRILGFVCFNRFLVNGHCSASVARGLQPEQHELGFAVSSDFAGPRLEFSSAAQQRRRSATTRAFVGTGRAREVSLDVVVALPRCALPRYVRTQVCVF